MIANDQHTDRSPPILALIWSAVILSRRIAGPDYWSFGRSRLYRIGRRTTSKNRDGRGPQGLSTAPLSSTGSHPNLQSIVRLRSLRHGEIDRLAAHLIASTQMPPWHTNPPQH